MNPLEIATVVLGLLSVWFTVRQNIWCWPTGIAMVALYAVLAYEVRLYSDVGLQAIYLAMQIYGWYHWLHGGRDGGVLPVTRQRPVRFTLCVVAALVAAAALGMAMDRLTDADVPYWNATATTLSLTAQWLMAKKKLECWAIWITVDVLYVGIFLAKRMYLMAFLYSVFLVLAATGLFEWRRHLATSH